nr:AMP nucleosidase [Pseudomonadota bacterium]
MEKRIYPEPIESVVSPEPFGRKSFTDAAEAVATLRELYSRNTRFLRDSFAGLAEGGDPNKRYRAFYPEVGLTTSSYSQVDSRQAYGHMPTPGHFSTTVTQPHLFERYLVEQLQLIMRNHGVPVTVSESSTPIPIHFAFLEGTYVDASAADHLQRPIRDLFDVPDLDGTDDHIANGTFESAPGESRPLAPFTAQRVDYSLHRLSHYTATSPHHFQSFVLFTNYQFYVDEFEAFARKALADPDSGYTAFVGPGNHMIERPDDASVPVAKAPQMPAYHLTADRGRGITMVNIGVGPSNAKTITDHIAVLRPHAWIMLGHCAGLR